MSPCVPLSDSVCLASLSDGVVRTPPSESLFPGSWRDTADPTQAPHPLVTSKWQSASPFEGSSQANLAFAVPPKDHAHSSSWSLPEGPWQTAAGRSPSNVANEQMHNDAGRTHLPGTEKYSKVQMTRSERRPRHPHCTGENTEAWGVR